MTRTGWVLLLAFIISMFAQFASYQAGYIAGLQHSQPSAVIVDPNADVVAPALIYLPDGHTQYRCPHGYALHGEDFLCHAYVWDDGVTNQTSEGAR